MKRDHKDYWYHTLDLKQLWENAIDISSEPTDKGRDYDFKIVWQEWLDETRQEFRFGFPEGKLLYSYTDKGILDGDQTTKYNSNDIVYTDLVTGVKGNYLKPSLAAAGFDPDNLPKSDPSKMDFSTSDGMDKKKAWKDIWGCGQGIGAIKDVLSCNGLVERLKLEYNEAKNRLNKIA